MFILAGRALFKASGLVEVPGYNCGPIQAREIVTFPFDDRLRQTLTGHVHSFDRRQIDNEQLRPAGVALVVAEADSGGACLLLTRRSTKLRRHAGQFALPGGRLDAGETFQEAALRELNEELGLDYPADAVIGPLDDYETQSGFCIRPFVIWGGPLADMKPDPVEVSIVYQIPLGELNSPAIPQFSKGLHPESPVLSAPIPATQNTIHAPTAALIYQFREVAMNGRATRVGHYGEPQFAWK